MRTIATISLDIVKSIFQINGVDAVGEVIVGRELKRRYVLAFFHELPDSPGGGRMLDRERAGLQHRPYWLCAADCMESTAARSRHYKCARRDRARPQCAVSSLRLEIPLED